MTAHKPILCVVATKHWPLSMFPAQATPAIGSAVVVAQYFVTVREEQILRGLCEFVAPSTEEGLALVQRKYPHVPYESLGFVWGCEVPQ